DDQLFDKLFSHHNFGHKGQEAFSGLGINAKMSELQAAMGLAVLPYIISIIKERKRIISLYKFNLIGLSTMKLREDTSWNFAYYPILFKTEPQLLAVQKLLNAKN